MDTPSTSGKEEVLPDFRMVARLRRRPPRVSRRCLLTSHSGALDRDVGPIFHKRCQRLRRPARSVVAALSVHGDAFALRLKPLDHFGILIRQHVRFEPVDATERAAASAVVSLTLSPSPTRRASITNIPVRRPFEFVRRNA